MLVQVAEPQNRHALEMVAVCTASLRRGSCQLAVPHQASAEKPRAVAVVSWKEKKNKSVLVEVGLDLDGATRWLSRRIEFQPLDGVAERWRVVGLTVATLVGDLEDAQLKEEREGDSPPEAATAPPVAAAAVQPEPVPPPAAPVIKSVPKQPVTPEAIPPAQTRQQEMLWAGSLGAATNPQIPRFGGWLRGLAFPERRWFPTLALSYSLRPTDERGLSVSWAGISAGGGVRFGVPALRLQSRLRVELLVERVTASAVNAETGARDGRWHLLAAGRGGVELEWLLGKRVGLLGGLDAILYQQPVRVRMAGSQAATFSRATYLVGAGATMRF